MHVTDAYAGPRRAWDPRFPFSCPVPQASSRATSSCVSSRSAAAAESVIDVGRLAPGMGMTTGDCASSQARATCWALTPRASATSAKAAAAAPARAQEKAARDESAGTGYGERRADRVEYVDFQAHARPEGRHFIKYEWRETLCRRGLLDCGERNRFWDEAMLGFAPPPPRRR